MIELAIIPVSAACNLARGRGYKLPAGIVLASLYTLLFWIDSKSLTLYTFTAFPVIFMAWYASNIMGTGYLFNAIHGRDAPKWKGMLYGCARGLTRLSFTIPLALIYHKWQIAPVGLLGGFSGVYYYLAGKVMGEQKYTVPVAELIDGALGYGLPLAVALTIP